MLVHSGSLSRVKVSLKRDSPTSSQRIEAKSLFALDTFAKYVKIVSFSAASILGRKKLLSLNNTSCVACQSFYVSTDRDS